MKSKYYQIKISGLILSLFGLCSIATAQTPSDSLRKDPVVPVDSLNTMHVVPIGYGMQPAKNVSSAISRVDGKDLRFFFNTNTANKLFGRLPGLTVSQNGNEDLENGPGLDYRGRNTFGSGGAILVLVDGFITDVNQFAKLAPEEIASVALLKDASATAIYGARGANGVLLVTTVRGKISPLKVSFSTQNGFSTGTNVPKYLGSFDYARLYNEALINDKKAALYTQADLDAYANQSNPFLRPDVNWYNEVLRKTAPVSNYNLNLTGGNETVKYFVMLGSLNTHGLYKNFGDESDQSINSRFHRYSFRSNVDINVTKRFSAALSLGGTVEDKSNPAAITTAGILNSLSRLPPNAFPVRNPNGTFGGTNSLTNPVADLLNNGAYTTNGRTLQSTLRVTQLLDMLADGLSASAAISFNTYFVSAEQSTNTVQRYSISSQNPDGTYNYSTPFGTAPSPVLAISGNSPDQYRNYAIQGSLNYAKVFGKHDISALAIFNADEINLRSQNNAIASDPFKHNSVGGRLTYVNNQKYIGEFSVSYMGSNNFPEGNRYGLFPAGSLGWIASNENFLKNSRVVNFLKFRGSYGLVGNDNIGGARYAFNQRYTTGGASGNFFLGQTANQEVFGTAEAAIANTGITWEKEEKFNVGMEATLFKNFSITFDYFNHNRRDILAIPAADLPLYMGVIRSEFNVGKANNKGFETSLRYSSPDGKNVKFFLEPSLWYSKNKIVYNSEAIPAFPYLANTGLRIGQPRYLVDMGLFSQAEIDEFTTKRAAKQPTFAVPANYIPQAGDIKYKDQNGDNVINDNDRFPVGDLDLPKFSAGLHTGVQFKGFDLDLFFQGVRGRTINLGSNSAYFYAFQNNGQVSDIALGRWTPATAATATYPRLSTTDNTNNYLSSTFWNRSGDFIKLRSAELAYTLNTNLIKKVKLSSAKIYINGTNLFSIDDFEYGDPETFSGYPTLRTLSLGTRIQF